MARSAKAKLPGWSRLCTTHTGIDAAWTERLRRAGLDDPTVLFGGELGEPFKVKGGLRVYRVQSPDGSCFYLKRTVSPPFASGVRSALRLLTGRGRDHTEGYTIRAAEQAMRQIDIQTMPVVAWGERRWLGLAPGDGYMLAAEVVGDEVSRLFRESESPVREDILAEIARIMARQHAHGLIVQLRLRDFIRVQPPHTPGGSALVMIDLDFKGAPLTIDRFDPPRAARLTARSLSMFLRAGGVMSAREYRVFLRAYFTTLRAHGVRVPRGWLRDVRARVGDTHDPAQPARTIGPD